MKNTVQIYGLPRSGTNFAEWTLKEYFKDIKYENLYKKCDVEKINIYGAYVAAKHSYPSFEFSDNIIVIYKDLNKWGKSYKKWLRERARGRTDSIEKWSDKDDILEIWENYLNKAKELNIKNCIIISHDELYNNYKNNIKLFSKKFNLKLKEKEIILPKNCLDKGGAKVKLKLGKIYKHG